MDCFDLIRDTVLELLRLRHLGWRVRHDDDDIQGLGCDGMEPGYFLYPRINQGVI